MPRPLTRHLAAPATNSATNSGDDTDAKSKSERRRPSKKAPWWFRVIRSAGLVYLVVVLVMVWMEPRLVYPGAYRDLEEYPADHFDRPDNGVTGRLPVVTVRYASAGTDELPGRYLKRPGADHWLLYFHGNAEWAIENDGEARRLSKAFNANVLVAEYRGFTDDATPTENGLLADGLAAWDWLNQQREQSTRDPSNADVQTLSPSDMSTSGRMIIMGRSLGGGVATLVATHPITGGAIDDYASASTIRRCDTLVIDRSFDSMVNTAAEHYRWLPVRWLMRNRYDSAARLIDYDGQLIVVHGPPDDIVPFRRGRRLYETATTTDKTFFEIPNLGHLDRLPDEALGRIAEQIFDPSPGETAAF